jgi:uroporphyrinogen-III synthase
MRALARRKPLVTRSVDDAADWAAALAAEGAEPIVLPCIHAEPINDPTLKEQLAAAVARADWIIFTSRRGVDVFAQLHGPALPAQIRLAAVGEATAERLRHHFGRAGPGDIVDLIGTGTAAALGRMLVTGAAIGPHSRCMLVLAANAGDALERTLEAAGATVERFDVYRTIPSAPVEPKRQLSSLGCDSVLFASPSAVAGFANQVDVDLDAQIITIGPSTSAAVRARRWIVTAEAKEPSLPGIIECLLETSRV